MTTYSTMPSQTNGSVYPSSVPGNEYGITNVSSHGRVNITVIPPNKMGRQLSPAVVRTTPSDSSYSSQQQRYYSSSSSPRSPPMAASSFNGNNSNNITSSTQRSTTVHSSSAQYNPSANKGEQLLKPAAPAQPSGKEQSDLDEILRELLGESHNASTTTTTTTRNEQVTTGADDQFVRERQQYTNPDGSTTTIEKRKYKAPNVTENVTINKTSSRKVHTATQNGSAPEIDSSGLSWLQQQQMKLNQRQRAFDDVDSSDQQTYYSQKDIIVNQQPVAYTVLIKPEEEKRRQEEVRQQNETNLSKKSVTNVSHTHHTHYNFKDAEDSSANGSTDSSQMLQTLEDQKNRIKQLEDELMNVKLGLQKKQEEVRTEQKKVETKPPRPPKQELEEEEILSFKPVGIASLESGTGQQFIHSNTMKSSQNGMMGGAQNGMMGGAQNGMMGGAQNGMMGGAQNGTMSGGHFSGTMRSQPHSPLSPSDSNYPPVFPPTPTTPYQFMPTSPAVRSPQWRQQDYGTSASGGGGGRRVVSESQHVQHSFSQGGQQMGVEAGSPQYNQSAQMVNDDMGGMQGTMGNSGGSQRYGYTTSQSYHSGMNQQGAQSGTLPHNQTLHVNTGENRYATVGGLQGHPSGHVHFTNSEESSGMHQPVAAATLRSGAAGGYSGGGYTAHGTGYNPVSQSSATMGGSRYNLHHAPLSPSAASYHAAGSMYQQQHTGPPSVYHGASYGSRRGSMQSLVAASEMFGHAENSHVTAKFVKDSSKYWYKPTISRDEVINQLKDSQPGTFIVRDSNSFPGAFGLAVRVFQLPANVQARGSSGNDSSEYVRFYLIEPTTKGVKLKGCSNEPVFASLAALIYQHTITPLALPCKLLLPDPGFTSVTTDQPDGMMSGSALNADMTSSATELLKHGAACNVVYLSNVDTESLTGPQAISRAVQQTFSKGSLDTTIATFKASSDGITLTDTNHRLFFRQHFPKESVSFCGIDPADRRFTQSLENGRFIKEAKMFGFVAKKKKGGNHCLLFAELDAEQPASAIVNFVTKVMMNK